MKNPCLLNMDLKYKSVEDINEILKLWFQG